MRAKRWFLPGLLVLLALGCAKSDWIAGTLVTVDVSGVWRGRMDSSALYALGGAMEMTLAQRGGKVTGEALIRAERIKIEGTVRGDVFSFGEPSGRLRAEATVVGDQMSGSGKQSFTSRGPAPFSFTLSR